MPYRYVGGAALALAPAVIMWLGRPEYFGYLDANYLWLSILALVCIFAGGWLAMTELSRARKRD
jgi:hypothetical protein